VITGMLELAKVWGETDIIVIKIIKEIESIFLAC
jgi:hypothetical protein